MTAIEPIMQACLDGDEHTVRELLTANPDLVNKRSKCNVSWFPLICAIENCHFDLAKLLITEFRAPINEIAYKLFLYNVLNTPSNTDKYFDMFCFVVGRSELTDLDKSTLGNTPPLHLTCRSDVFIDYTRTLLERGANPNAYHEAVTVLIRAAIYGSVETVRCLLAHNADKSAPVFVDMTKKHRFGCDVIHSIWYGENMPIKIFHQVGMNVVDIVSKILEFKRENDYDEEDDDVHVVILRELGVEVLAKKGFACPICQLDCTANKICLFCNHEICKTCAIRIQDKHNIIKCPFCREDTDLSDAPLLSTLYLCEFMRTHEYKTNLSTTTVGELVQHVLGLITSGKASVSCASASFVYPRLSVRHNSKLIVQSQHDMTLKEYGIKPNDRISWNYKFLS